MPTISGSGIDLVLFSFGTRRAHSHTDNLVCHVRRLSTPMCGYTCFDRFKFSLKPHGRFVVSLWNNLGEIGACRLALRGLLPMGEFLFFTESIHCRSSVLRNTQKLYKTSWQVTRQFALDQFVAAPCTCIGNTRYPTYVEYDLRSTQKPRARSLYRIIVYLIMWNK